MSRQPEDGGKTPVAASAAAEPMAVMASTEPVGGGAARSSGTTASGQSVSTSGGSAGSPSNRSETAVAATPISDGAFVRIHGDDSGSQGAPENKKKRRGQRASGADKNGRGLRQFSMRVCEKVESKGRTTYNEVADELVAEFSDPCNSLAASDQYDDEKNIRRRVYDALNVLMAMDIISKDKKDIQWRGLPRTSQNDIDELKRARYHLRTSIEKKATYLHDLEEQFMGLQKLIKRNEQLYSSGHSPTGGIALPFILVQTRPHATVEVELSEDMQLVHFDFSSTPFELHDDNYVLKAMGLCSRPHSNELSIRYPEESGMTGPSMPEVVYQPRQDRPPICPPPVPGILKAARVKQEH